MPVTCDVQPAPDPQAVGPNAPASPPPNCTSDDECSERPYGVCKIEYYAEGPAPATCKYGCLNDADCGTGAVCVCDGAPYGSCYRADCTSDADCPGDLLCALILDGQHVCGPAPQRFACQTTNDACDDAFDCRSSDDPNRYCSIESGVRACEPVTVMCGRPFLVEGEARKALACRNAAWLPRNTLQPSIPQGPLAARLADVWTELGLMEHASIAAFGRFTLQLLELGAPADLVAAAQRAIGDETRHAQVCFGLASAYAQRPIGAEALSMGGAMGTTSVEDIVLLAVLEGCVGETTAALEAAEAAKHVSDPVVRAALQQIHEDELRHAELSWQFVAWAMSRPDTAVLREAVQRLVSNLESETHFTTCNSELPPSDQELLAHGVIGDTLRPQIRNIALKEIVLPCAMRLLAKLNTPNLQSAA